MTCLPAQCFAVTIGIDANSVVYTAAEELAASTTLPNNIKTCLAMMCVSAAEPYICHDCGLRKWKLACPFAFSLLFFDLHNV